MQLIAALTWWCSFLGECIPQSIQPFTTATRHVVSYSDGEGSESGGVGCALWFAPNTPPKAGFIKVPHVVRRLWRIQRKQVWRDIFELEAIGPLLILVAWGSLMEGAVWTHYIDNNAALAALVRGSSSVMSGDIIVGATWRRVAQLAICPWFDRVESSANPVGGLSRGRMSGPWNEVMSLTIPQDVIEELRQWVVADRRRGTTIP